MRVTIRAYREQDLDAMLEIWNEVVADGIAFPRPNRWIRRTARCFLPARA
jgi:hypothetical protein